MLPSWSDYRDLRRSWKGDLLAGITVAVVALPLALAFGVSSGVGAEAGLITAIVAGLVAAIFGGSNVQVSGPTGAMVVVLAPIVLNHGIGAVAVVCLLAGSIVLLAGVLRFGRAVSTIPWPVIEGFTVGIGIIIFMQQVPAAVGVASSGHSSNAIVAAIESVQSATWPSAVIPLALVALVAIIMIVMARFTPRIPGSFVAIVIATVIAVIFTIPVPAIGELPQALPPPHIPFIDWDVVPSLIGPSFAVAALAAIESLLSARVAASMSDTGPVNADRELFGQGLASIASGLFGGMPATGAIARTAVNVRAGAQTRAASIVHSLALLAVVYLAANIVSTIPLAALSGVLMVTAAKMVSPKTIKEVMRSTKSDAVVFIVTAIITVSFDLVIAVGIGIAVAAFFALRALSTASGVHREELPGKAENGDERIALFRVDGSLFFGAAERILDRIGNAQGIEVVVLRLSQLQIIDATGAHTLSDLVTSLERRNVTVLVKGIRPEHASVLERAGVFHSLSHQNHLFDDLDGAIAHARSHIVKPEFKCNYLNGTITNSIATITQSNKTVPKITKKRDDRKS